MNIFKCWIFVFIPVFMLSGLWLGYLKYVDYRETPPDPPSYRPAGVDDPERWSADDAEDRLLADALRDPGRFDAEAAVVTKSAADTGTKESDDSEDTGQGTDEELSIALTPNWAVIEGTRRMVDSYASIRTQAMRNPDSNLNAAQRSRMMDNMRLRLDARRGEETPSASAD